MSSPALTLWNNRPVRVVDGHYPGGALITDPNDPSGELVVVPTKELKMIDAPEAPSREGLTRLSPVTWQKAEQRFNAAQALINMPDLSTAIVEDAARKLGLSARTVYRDIRRTERASRPSALVPQKVGRRSGKRMLDPQVEECIADYLNEIYLQKNRPSASQVCEEIQAACRRKDLPVPCIKSVMRRIEALDAYETIKRRHGPKAARYKLKPMVGHVSAALPLDIVQMDHTPANVQLVSEDEMRTEIGRATLTMAIDVCTRVILGFHISFEPPCSTSTALCLTHALLPKDQWLESIGLDVTWPFFGKMKMLHTDNGADFQAEALRRGCAEVGIEISFRQIGAPHQGGHIERLMGTMSGLFTLLPGATQRDTRELGGKDARTLPVMTLNEFRRWVANEVAIYHRRLHRGINCTPIEKWNEAVQAGFRVPRVPDEWERLNTLTNFLPYEKRLIRRTGIQLWDIHYWTTGLEEWVGDGTKREVFFDPRDVSTIYLRGPEGKILEATPTRPDIPAVSLQEWRVIRARQRKGLASTLIEHDQAMENRREMIRASTKATRSAHKTKSKNAEKKRDVEGIRNEKPKDESTTAPCISATRESYAVEAWSES